VPSIARLLQSRQSVAGDDGIKFLCPFAIEQNEELIGATATPDSGRMFLVQSPRHLGNAAIRRSCLISLDGCDMLMLPKLAYSKPRHDNGRMNVSRRDEGTHR
jgi:hypothetical protein